MVFYLFLFRITMLGVLGILIAMASFVANSVFTLQEKLEKIKQGDEMKQPLLEGKKGEKNV